MPLLLPLMIPRSLVIDHLRDGFSQQNAVVAHIYCNYGEHEDQSVEKMLASLLKQLVIPSPKIRKPVKEFYQKFRTRQPQQQDLEQTFLLTCDNYDRVFIVIDALDECDANPKRALLDHIQSNPSVSIFVTSRSYPENVLKNFEAARRISIGAHVTDLRKYILQEIENSIMPMS